MSERSAAEASASPRSVRAHERKRNGRSDLDLGRLNDRLGYFVRRLQIWIFQDFIRAMAPFDIRPAQYSVLVVIEANPGLSQTELAELLGIERARLVRLLDKLEKRGLLRRDASARDRRSHELYLTRDGARRLKRIEAVAAAHEARVTERLGSDNRNLLIDVLRGFAR